MRQSSERRPRKMISELSSKYMWKDVVGFEGMYKVSDRGELFSISKNRLIPKRLDRYGYVKYELSKEGKKFYRTGHKLVALAFIPNPENLPSINHMNLDKADNRLDNLEWCSNKQNTNHAILKRGEWMSCKGEKNVSSKLTYEDVKEIRSLKGTMLQKELAKKFGVTPSQISNIMKGKQWAF
jgi:hypothetical protein